MRKLPGIGEAMTGDDMHSDGLVTAPRLRNDTNNRRGPFSKCNEDGMLCKNEEGVNACYECMNACMREQP